jgi:hypothetical protein
LTPISNLKNNCRPASANAWVRNDAWPARAQVTRKKLYLQANRIRRRLDLEVSERSARIKSTEQAQRCR